jgi:hypothetical protein
MGHRDEGLRHQIPGSGRVINERRGEMESAMVIAIYHYYYYYFYFPDSGLCAEPMT